MVELPLVVVDVQRAGPSTGMPTKTEQADLLMAMFGRNSDSPVPIVAPATPAECFDYAIEAWRLALKYMTPVIYMSDAFLATGSEPWRVPSVADLPDISVANHTDRATFQPYSRDPETLARPWAPPGTPGLEHRIGGLEKADVTGNVSYDPDNHHRMQVLRHEKVAGIAERHSAARGPRAGVGRPADPRLGLHLRRHPERHRAPAGRGLERRPRPSAPPEPVAGEHRSRCCAATGTCSCRRSTSASCRCSSARKFLIDVIGFNKVRGKPYRIIEIKQAAEELLGQVTK